MSMITNNYAGAIADRLADVPEYQRYALCGAKPEKVLLDEWCLAPVPRDGREFELRVRALRRTDPIGHLKQMAPISVVLTRELLAYSRARDQDMRGFPDSRFGENFARRFDTEMMRGLPMLTDPLLYLLVGVGQEDAAEEWALYHPGRTPRQSTALGRLLVDRLTREMGRAAHDLKRTGEQEAEKRRNAQRLGLPASMGRLLR